MRLRNAFALLLLFTSVVACASSKAPPLEQKNIPLQEKVQPPASPPPEIPPSAPLPPGHQTQAPLPSSEEMTTSYESAFVRMLVTLLGLVFLVFATFWILRRLGKGKFKLGSGRSINVLERKALSPKTMLYVVEINNKQVLISESQLEVRTLMTIEDLPEANQE
jgi:flagellar biogenesis protein FliO